jgi:hypothetical protein
MGLTVVLIKSKGGRDFIVYDLGRDVPVFAVVKGNNHVHDERPEH